MAERSHSLHLRNGKNTSKLADIWTDGVSRSLSSRTFCRKVNTVVRVLPRTQFQHSTAVYELSAWLT